MGRGDEDALRAALATPASYVGLVASAKRGAATVAALRADGVDEETLARVRCPAGLDLGPSTQTEIAVAVLAELVAWRHGRRQDVGAALGAIAEAVDPVCGMSVPVAGARETADPRGRHVLLLLPRLPRPLRAQPREVPRTARDVRVAPDGTQRQERPPGSTLLTRGIARGEGGETARERRSRDPRTLDGRGAEGRDRDGRAHGALGPPRSRARCSPCRRSSRSWARSPAAASSPRSTRRRSGSSPAGRRGC